MPFLLIALAAGLGYLVYKRRQSTQTSGLASAAVFQAGQRAGLGDVTEEVAGLAAYQAGQRAGLGDVTEEVAGSRRAYTGWWAMTAPEIRRY